MRHFFHFYFFQCRLFHFLTCLTIERRKLTGHHLPLAMFDFHFNSCIGICVCFVLSHFHEPILVKCVPLVVFSIEMQEKNGNKSDVFVGRRDGETVIILPHFSFAITFRPTQSHSTVTRHMSNVHNILDLCIFINRLMTTISFSSRTRSPSNSFSIAFEYVRYICLIYLRGRFFTILFVSNSNFTNVWNAFLDTRKRGDPNEHTRLNE